MPYRNAERLIDRIDWLFWRLDARKKASGEPKKCGRGWRGTNPPGCTRPRNLGAKKTQKASSSQHDKTLDKRKPAKVSSDKGRPATSPNGGNMNQSDRQKKIVEYLTPKTADFSGISAERKKAFGDYARITAKVKWAESDAQEAELLFEQLRKNGDITQAAALKDRLNRHKKGKGR